MSAKADTEFDYEIVNDKIRPIAEKLIQKYDKNSFQRRTLHPVCRKFISIGHAWGSR